jgi:hypothetical protein
VSRTVNGHTGPGFGQRNGNARAQPARRPGNQRYLALEIELFKYQGSLPFPVARS